MDHLARRPSPVQVIAGAFCWLLTAVWFVLQPVVAGAWPRPYDYVTDPVSDLGAVGCRTAAGRGGLATRYVCSPWHLSWNAIFVACGLLIIVGAVLLRGCWPRRALTKAGNVLLVTSGAGLIIVGLFPEDDAFLVHAVAAVVQIPAQGVALLLLGIGLVSSRRGLAVWTLACAAIALAGTVIFFSPLSGAVGYGLAERLALAPFMAWLVVTGAILLGSEHRGRDWARSGR